MIVVTEVEVDAVISVNAVVVAVVVAEGSAMTGRRDSALAARAAGSLTERPKLVAMVAMVAATEATTEEEVTGAAAVAGHVESAMTGNPGIALAERAAASLTAKAMTQLPVVVVGVTSGLPVGVTPGRGVCAMTSKLENALAERAAASLTLQAETSPGMMAQPASIRQP